MQKKHLEWIIKILIGATFFVPLIVLPASYIFPFIVPKIVWFRSLVLIMLGLYILLLSINWQEYRIRLTPVNIVVGLFFVSFAISTFVGVDWYRSFWDNHERMLGLFTIFHYIVYYFVITSVIKEWKDWKWLLRIFLLAGSLVMFIGFLQTYVNHDLVLNRGALARVASTLGNAIYYSGYGLFLMFVGYLLAIKENNKKTNPWFWYAVVGSLFGFWGIFGGGTRGALLGLIAGLGVLAISYIFSLKEHKKIRQGLGGLIVFGIIILSLFFIFRQTNFVKSIPAVGRLVNTQFSSTDTRVMAWGVAIDAWQEKPVFGWGPNNYYYAFNKYYNPKFLEFGWGETWFDNAHSVVMNTLAVQGSVGIITYLGIFAVAITMLWRSYKKNELDVHIISVGSAFLIAHLVSLVTVFDNPTSYLCFFFFLAFINQNADNSKQIADNKNQNKSISSGLMVVVGLVILLFVYSTNINPARANNATLETIKTVSSGNIKNSIDLYGKVGEYATPHIDDVRNDFARVSGTTISNLAQSGKLGESRQLFDFSYEELKKNLTLHPLDIRIHIQLAQLGMFGAQMKQDVSLLIEAEGFLDEALVYSPKRQQVQYSLSSLKLQLGKNDEAVKLIQDSIDNDPNIAEGYWRLALTYKQIGEEDRAKEILQSALDRGVKFDSQGQQVVGSIMQSESL